MPKRRRSGRAPNPEPCALIHKPPARAATCPGAIPPSRRDEEVRDFAAKQNASVDTFLEEDAGMAAMSDKFREKGGEIYLSAAE